jgi:hypothetical protein
MGLEGEDTEGRSHARGFRARHGKQRLVAAMHTIEIANGDHAPAHGVGYRIIAANNLQSQ